MKTGTSLQLWLVPICLTFLLKRIKTFHSNELTMLAIKTFFEGAFLWSIQRLFNQTHLLLLLPVAEIFHIVYVLVIGIWGNVGTYNWKGRDLK